MDSAAKPDSVSHLEPGSPAGDDEATPTQESCTDAFVIEQFKQVVESFRHRILYLTQLSTVFVATDIAAVYYGVAQRSVALLVFSSLLLVSIAVLILSSHKYVKAMLLTAVSIERGQKTTQYRWLISTFSSLSWKQSDLEMIEDELLRPAELHRTVEKGTNSTPFLVESKDFKLSLLPHERAVIWLTSMGVAIQLTAGYYCYAVEKWPIFPSGNEPNITKPAPSASKSNRPSQPATTKQPKKQVVTSPASPKAKQKPRS